MPLIQDDNESYVASPEINRENAKLHQKILSHVANDVVSNSFELVSRKAV